MQGCIFKIGYFQRAPMYGKWRLQRYIDENLIWRHLLYDLETMTA